MKIEKISKLKTGKYKIELEDKTKIITYDDVILKNNLLFNKNLDNSQINDINKDSLYYQIYNKTLNYIMIKMRSIKEIKVYLDKQDIDIKDKTKIINQLKENKLLDDYSFCKSFISDKVYLTNNGPLKIKKELIEHDIDEEVIDEIINNYEREIFLTKINKIIQKKTSVNKKSKYELKQKLVQDLKSLGYDVDMIYDSVSKVDLIDINTIDKEYDKIYKKLSNKYSGSELEYKLKNKLYQKGYSLDEINSKIKKD